jgi:hypothetical protein
MYNLKGNKTFTYYGTNIKSEAGPPHVKNFPNLPCDTRVKQQPRR